MVSDLCSVCSVFLGSSIKRRKLIEIVELLEILLVQLNLISLVGLIICESCIIKVQSACKFKTRYYLENSQHSCIKREDIEDEAVCEICKENVNRTDCVPLFFSLTENDKLNLLKFLSLELQPKSQDSPQTCESCHNSILNFCMIIKSFSAFAITAYEDFLCKNEEVDLKPEVELSSKNQYTERSSILQCSGNLSIDRNNSYLTAGIVKIEMDSNECGNADNEKNNYENLNDNFGEMEMKCRNYEFQNNHTNDLYQHATIHKSLNDIDKPQCQNREFLQKHVFVHKNINDKMFKCHNCQYQTEQKGNLKRHMLIHKDTDEVEMFKCQHCQWQTKFKYYLKEHTLIHNAPEKMFKCQNCQYQTVHKGYLKKHMLIHRDTNEVEMFKCQHCQFQTKHKISLKKHMLIHKDTNEVKMFKCQLCQFQTKHKNNLKQHVFIHKLKKVEMRYRYRSIEIDKIK